LQNSIFSHCQIQTSNASHSETPNRAHKEAFLQASSPIDASLRARFGGEVAFPLVIQVLLLEFEFATVKNTCQFSKGFGKLAALGKTII